MKNRKKQSRAKATYIVVLGLVPLTAALLSLVLKLDFLLSTILFFGVPALYLSLKETEKVPRVLVFSVLFSLAGLYADYIAERDLAWAGPSTIFPVRIGGLVPIENLVWFFLLTYFILIFYEHFFDHFRHKTVGRRMYLLYIVLVLATLAFCALLLLDSRAMTVSYFYLKLGLILGLLPVVAFLVGFPKFLGVFLKTAPYFIALCLLNEFVGLHNGYWTFPGHDFIGWVHLGSYRIPWEELIFWIVMFSSIVIIYFEVFDDNRLHLGYRSRPPRPS